MSKKRFDAIKVEGLFKVLTDIYTQLFALTCPGVHINVKESPHPGMRSGTVKPLPKVG
jgi:hypothetical protein